MVDIKRLELESMCGEYTNKRIIAELLLIIEHGYEVDQLVRWADDVWLQGNIDSELEDLIAGFRAMCCGEEFYVPIDETINVMLSVLQKEKDLLKK